MSQIEQLEIFVSERLHAATSDILVAITKTVKNYEKEVSRLKEENERHRSVLDIILKTKSSETKAKVDTKSSATSPHSSDTGVKQKTGQTNLTSAIGLQSAFTTRDEFLKLAGKDNCPFCLKRVQRTEKHLVKRHYLPAVHFILEGNTKFVIPCMCKAKIQDRSHWHCPLCKKIIYRRCNFNTHLTKQHRIALVQPSQDTVAKQPLVTVLKEEIPLIPEPWCQQERSSLEQQYNQASLLLPAKNDTEQETHLQVQYDQQDRIQNGQIREQNIELNPNQHSGLNIVCVDACIQDISEICIRNSLSDFSTQTLDRKPESGVIEMSDLAEGNQLTTGSNTAEETGSCTKTEESDMTQMTSRCNQLDPKKKEPVQISVTPTNLYTKKGRKLPASQNMSGSFRCKACGKKFHYMYTLKTHVRTHARDKTCICGICGKRLGYRESLIQHIRSHNKRNICGTCGKEFSSDSRLKRHKRFHLPKGLNR